jgi:hypothetical protein
MLWPLVSPARAGSGEQLGSSKLSVRDPGGSATSPGAWSDR